MHVIVRSRVFLARHRWLYWATVVAMAGAVALLVNGRLAEVDAQRARWGERRAVLVAATDMAPDDPIEVHLVDLPLAAAPPTALTELPAGARLRQHVAEGEVIVRADLSAGDGPARHADRGAVVVGIVDPLSPDAAIGLRVRVTSGGIVLSSDATIVSIADDVVFVAVAERDGPMVAAAAREASASLLFLP